jgi:hypothetical protein
MHTWKKHIPTGEDFKVQFKRKSMSIYAKMVKAIYSYCK